jgi:hypothetical protein
MRSRSEVLRDNCIRDNRDHKRIKGGAKDCVLFAAGIRMNAAMFGDAYHV